MFDHGLTASVAILVPSTVNVSDKADEMTVDFVVQNVAGVLSDLFGGATVTRGRGFYRASSGAMVAEDVTIVQAYGTAEDVERHSPRVWSLAVEVCRSMRQESVAVLRNGVLYFAS